MRARWLAAASLLALSLARCSADEVSPDDGTGSTDAAPTERILQPGRPGEDNTVATTPVDVATPTVSKADVTFMQEMIVHHAQAIEMAALVEGDLEDAEVQAIAARIEAAQRPEVEAMATWLAANGHPVPAVAADLGVDLERLGADELPMASGEGHGDGHEGHGAEHEMPGMATPEQLLALDEAQGREADLLFLELMSAHHEGALAMLNEHAPGASDLRATEMADEMAAEQQAEIGRMADIEARLQAPD